jgi:translation elongation factor EF-1alpha
MPKKKSAKKPTGKVNKAKPVKKQTPKKKAKPAPVKKAPTAKRKVIGTIRHFFPHISVAVVDLSGSIKVGDRILIEGMASSFTQKVDSMQIEHESIKSAGKGQAIGLKVKEVPREGDTVYLV